MPQHTISATYLPRISQAGWQYRDEAELPYNPALTHWKTPKIFLRMVQSSSLQTEKLKTIWTLNTNTLIFCPGEKDSLSGQKDRYFILQNERNKKYMIIQISSGQGPAECRTYASSISSCCRTSYIFFSALLFISSLIYGGMNVTIQLLQSYSYSLSMF